MKRRYKILILVIFILSIIWCAFNINTYMKRRNWVTTTATITFVGLPDGAVIGTYTDINNHIHSDVTLYIDPFYKGYNANVDRIIGKKIDIIYNPLTGEVAKSNTMHCWISLFLFLLSSLLLCLCFKNSFTHIIKRQNIINLIRLLVIVLFVGALFDVGLSDTQNNNINTEAIVNDIDTEEKYIISDITTGNVVSLEYIPPFFGQAYVEVDGNIPSFTEEEFTTVSFELYSELDFLGRPCVAYANIGLDLMPTEDRGEIGQIKPVGWHTVKYDCIDGLYLYNRCHLIGYRLTGENDNINNLMTGTRYLNVQGMLTFENMVAEYVLSTGNHVLYRVTPIYEEDNLIAAGVQMEGYSVEDNGEGICFNVFCYNLQPGIVIDYKNGDSYKQSPETTADGYVSDDLSTEEQISVDYVVNKNTYKFHYLYCSSVNDMKEKNKWYYSGDRQDLVDMGYQPCGRCNP